MNSFKLRIIFIIIGIIYILLVPAVFANELDATLSGEIDSLISENQNSGVENNKMKIYNLAGIEMIQLRDLAEEAGWSLYYDSVKKEIFINNNGQPFSLETLNTDSKGEESIIIREGRTYLPIGIVREVLQEMGEGMIITSLYTDQSVYRTDEKITAHLRLYNFTDKSIRLNFGSGQRYDLYLTQGDEELWRWSDDKFFTMALIYKELEAGESLEYDLELEPGLSPGEYILAGKLATLPEAMELNEVMIEIVVN